MMKLALMLIPCLVIAACQVAPPQPEPQPQIEPPPQTEIQEWKKFVDKVGRMDPEQLLLARESALRQYTEQPNDSNRLRAGYALSRAPASPQQLVKSRHILAGISPAGELAPMRDLLDGEILKFIEVQAAEARTLELRAEFDELQVRFAMLQEQLDALKKIEAEMVESQEETEEMEP